MQLKDPRYLRHLAELNRLADRLFEVIRDGYDTAPTVVLHLDRSDRLLRLRGDQAEIATATLLCAQLLRRATADPGSAQPRHVVGLTDFLDQLIPSLLPRTPNGATADTLRLIHARIDDISLDLALLADPGAPRYQ